MSQIPIANVYYLLLYAWDQFTPQADVDVGAVDSPDLPNLLGRILREGARRLVRRGLDRGYGGRVDALSAPRGRFLLAETAKRSGFISGSLVCQYDELSPDVIHNRILRAALAALAQSEAIDAALATDLKDLHSKLGGVAEVPLTKQMFSQLQLTRNLGQYRLLMKICEMICDLLLPEDAGHGSRFADVLQDEERMSAIFEAFLRNFYRQEQDLFSVSSEVVKWDSGPDPAHHTAYLPAMLTDITLRSGDRTLVIDAKFYRQTLVSYPGAQDKVRSAHLYQLISYLMNIARQSDRGKKVEGILLYPCVDGKNVSLEFQLLGHRVRACTIDLVQPWADIHRDLLVLIRPSISGSPAAAISA